MEEGKELYSQVTVPLEVGPVAKEQLLALTDPPVPYQEASTTVVITTAVGVASECW